MSEKQTMSIQELRAQFKPQLKEFTKNKLIDIIIELSASNMLIKKELRNIREDSESTQGETNE